MSSPGTAAPKDTLCPSRRDRVQPEGASATSASAPAVKPHGVRRPVAPLLAACAMLGTLAFAPAACADARGEMLYSTHCLACHTAQMHWRDKKAATDWSSLQAQVWRWQDAALLRWSDDDILEVTRYLNQRYYRFAPTVDPLGSLPPSPRSGATRAASGMAAPSLQPTH